MSPKGRKPIKNTSWENSTVRSLEISVGELICLFDEEAQKLCSNQREAQILAMAALRDFVNTYGKNVVVG